MKDTYLMNKETGEILPSKEVFKNFYSVKRGCLESVFDEWKETGLDVEDSTFDAPDFTKVF